MVNVALTKVFAAVKNSQFYMSVFMKIETETLLEWVFHKGAEFGGVIFKVDNFHLKSPHSLAISPFRPGRISFKNHLFIKAMTVPT